MSSLVTVGDWISISPCGDGNMCCGTAVNVTSCCVSGGGFMWLNATFSSSSPMTTFTVTAITTVFAPNTTAGSTECSCTSQNIALGAGLGVPLGVTMIIAMILSFLLYRAKRAQHHQSGNQPDGYEAREPPRGRSVKELSGTYGIREMPGSEVPELT